MSVNAEAADQVVKITLEGTEVIARLTGQAAKEVAMLIIAALKNPNKTKGRARLVQMLKSGKPLKVIQIQKEDVKIFQQQAKRYGIVYCVLRDRNSRSNHTDVDVFVREEDGPKINRIAERFSFNTVQRANYVNEAKKSLGKERERDDSPFTGEKENLSGKESKTKTMPGDRRNPSFGSGQTNERPSMATKLARKKKEYERDVQSLTKEREIIKMERKVRE